ncbi:MAG: 16S rRNA (guanine(527)-N(7))-methyltransferase RsmG [Oscillatoriaceae cyanobacterium Prado104]|jgi:16S rRNA (guanine527-N7)-methyltransferase|nr:16S rRNA (guanine(527)-N(7))-methyltransferase RsmG [Oscillatoriaceae cyanobacterium Prado104]
MIDRIETTILPQMTELWQQTLNWQPDELQQQQFQRLYELIVAGNRRLNLTRITEPIEFWEKHLWDSLRGISQLLPTDSNTNLLSVRKVIDIGTGAGFPGLPIAIVLPKLSVTLLDSTRKKIAFLETVVAELRIESAVPLAGRAEEIVRDSRYGKACDIAFLRAVAPASVCAKYALPLLKKGGFAVLYRGNWTAEEEAELASEIEPLSGIIESIESFMTPVSNSARHCIYLRKVS